MGMSQEEIEALMNESALGDIGQPEESETETATQEEELSQDDLAALIEEAEANQGSCDIEPPVEETESIEEIPEAQEDLPESNDDISQDELAALIEAQETENNESPNNDTSDDDIASMLAGIDGIVDNEEENNTSDDNENIDDLLAGIDGIVDNDTPAETENSTSHDISKVINEQIDKGVYPLPVEKEHKVVSQLNQVAEDSEEKASQIFDVLSFILDENSEIQNNLGQINDFIEKQTKLLEALSQKFPNIDVINQNYELAKSISGSKELIDSKLNEENNQIFQAMDLMQYHDINRQKIERVMSVIKKLNDYLNGLFEDDSDKPEVQIARHIAGDSNESVDADDLDALIAEYSN
jgi:hypothetical protein